MPRSGSVRVVTYNVRGFRDGRARVAGAVKDLRPDVLLLQETGSRRDLRRLTSDLGMQAAGDPWSPLRRRVKNAVLVADPWRITSAELIRFPTSRRWYPRGALAVRCAAGDRSMWALSVHLGLEGAERGLQATSLLDHVGTLGGAPVIVAGDLNATSDMRAAERIATALPDAWGTVGRGDGFTFPAQAPTARIDYIFVRGADVLAATVGAEGAPEASDHLPVTADLRIVVA